MYCYLCSEPIRDGENYCRGCGTATVTSRLSQHSWLSTVGHFSLGILGFGVFAILFVIFSTDFIRFTPFGRYLVIALAGGISLGFAIHFYLKNRGVVKHPVAKESLDARTSIDLLSEPTAVSFMSISDGLVIPTTSKLKIPRGE